MRSSPLSFHSPLSFALLSCTLLFTLSLFHIPSLFSLSSLLFPSGFRSHAHSLLALFLCQWHLNPLLLRCFSSTPARFPHEAAFFSLNLFFILQHFLSHSHFPSRILPCIVLICLPPSVCVHLINSTDLLLCRPFCMI